MKVAENVQGKVLTAAKLKRLFSDEFVSSGDRTFFADRFFEPAMKTDSSLSRIFGGIFGAQTGAGMALAIARLYFCRRNNKRLSV